MTVWLFRNPPIVCLIVLISTSYILRWKVSTINNDLLIFVIFYFTYFSSYKKLSFNLVIAILVPLFWIIYSSYRLRFVHFFSVTFLIVLCFVSTHIQLMFKLCYYRVMLYHCNGWAGDLASENLFNHAIFCMYLP